ncbi:MAG: hypothetical protein E5V63_30000 [Mesorhizobium sp.]|nr:MAG: hypothetical protein E5V63_30000 [Mesorhizobium sp.]
MTPIPAVAIPETTRDLEAVTTAAQRIFEVMCNGPVDWAKHAADTNEDSLFRSADWECCLAYAKAALASSSAAPSGEAEPAWGPAVRSGTRESHASIYATPTRPASPIEQGEVERLIEQLQDWMREPDFSDEFSVEDITDWINRRPTHIAPKLAARLTAMQAELAEMKASRDRSLEKAIELAKKLDRAEALTAATAVAVPGMVLVPKAAFDWLNGEGPDDNGHWFGDSGDVIKGAFWWRSVFRRMCLAASPSAQTDGGRG